MKMDPSVVRNAREDAMYLQDYLVDLNKWEKEIKEEDKKLSAHSSATDGKV